MDFARQQLQQGRFACPVRAKDGGVHPFFKCERKVFKHASVAPINGGLLNFEDGTFVGGGRHTQEKR